MGRKFAFKKGDMIRLVNLPASQKALEGKKGFIAGPKKNIGGKVRYPVEFRDGSKNKNIQTQYLEPWDELPRRLSSPQNRADNSSDDGSRVTAPKKKDRSRTTR